MAKILVGDVRAALEASKATWKVNPRLNDTDEIPHYSTGGTLEGMSRAEEIGRIDFEKVLEKVPSNPMVLNRRIESKILPRDLQSSIVAGASSLFPDSRNEKGGNPHPQAVDWRNRWGLHWITSVRQQNPCSACWAFAAVALVEAMVRIEHCVWPRLSEGDVYRSSGQLCGSTGGGNPEPALKWIAQNGVCDPGCFPWTIPDIPYVVCEERAGRSVRCPMPTAIKNIDDQKKWLDNVGPLVCSFGAYQDFMSYGSDVYHKHNAPWNTGVGLHYMLVVGYDDSQQCWIAKNSWGTGWGQSGYALIGYGECLIDDPNYPKIGLHGTDPDPWTKRRYHNGALCESRYGGSHRNFETAVNNGGAIEHWSRANDLSKLWNRSSTFAKDAGSQPTIIESTEQTFECVYQTTSRRLHHWWGEYDTVEQMFVWFEGPIFGPNDAAGVPSLIQSNYGHPGTLEVVVGTSDSRLSHWWRDLDKVWQEGPRFGKSVAHSGPSLIQSHYGTQGNYELICVLDDGKMQHWWRNNDTDKSWSQGSTFGSGVQSAPCMIEGAAWALDETWAGCFELCVAVNQHVQHWWRSTADMKWYYGATFGHDVDSVSGLLSSSYDCLELIAVRTDGRPQHYWRDGAGWHEGPVIG